LEVLKNGTIVDKIDISEKSYYVIGRLPSCDLALEHESISRYHAVIQHSSDGWAYLYDLNSTYGTKIGKAKVPPRRFVRLKVGSVIKFGESSRLYVLLGPEEFETDEMSASKQQQLQQYNQQHLMSQNGTVMSGEEYEAKMRKNVNEDEQEESEGVSWGMGEDAKEFGEFQGFEAHELDTSDNAWFMKDPRKILTSWMDQNGFDMTFAYEEQMEGREKMYVARLQLPIDTGYGQYALGSGSKKKDAERECVVDACRKLDAAGILRSDPSEIAAKRREKMKALLGDDDDDEDIFYDRTGAVEKKKNKSKKVAPVVETYDSLLSKKEELEKAIAEQEAKVAEAERKEAARSKKQDEEDDIDAYMKSLSSSVKQAAKGKLEKELADMKKEMGRLDRLIQLAKPSLGSFGANLQIKNPRAKPAPAAPVKKVETQAFEVEEEEDEENDGRKKSEKSGQPTTRGPSAPARPPNSGDAPPPRAPVRAPMKAPFNLVEDETADKPLKRKPEEILYDDQGDEDTTEKQPVVKGGEKKPRKYGAMTKERFDELTGGEENQVWWTPPQNQTGDGKTSLNERFGY